MMNNYEIAHNLSMLAKLMDIHGENSFRSKTYSIAAYNIEKNIVEVNTLPLEKIFSMQGIGDAIAKKIIELLQTGKIKSLEDLFNKTPPGVLEMLNIKGIGPKKISIIWKEMSIENIGELLYACHENRLLLYKGFGKKTQDNVIEAIQFYEQQQGNYLYAKVEELGKELTAYLQNIFSNKQVEITGAFKRHAETLSMLEFVVPESPVNIIKVLKKLSEFNLLDQNDDYLLYHYDEKIKIKLFLTDEESLNEKLFSTSATEEFMEAFSRQFSPIDFRKAANDEDIFKALKIQHIPCFLREDAEIITFAKDFSIPDVIQPRDIKGLIHCHSNWSDGSNTLEQLAAAALDSGLEYLVISDHSKAAYYAKGLSEEQIKAQHELVDELNKKYKPFKIFKSIESDILNDGNLDYSNSILSTFDLVIASVHSNLKMSQEKAMARLLKAIENPYTAILGHMTGRLLLSRSGFPVDHKKIIDACAANSVVIELNAHPRRLDMRWQWIDYALQQNVLISINPDAHSTEEFSNTRYGVLAAQKGKLTKKDNLSSYSLNEFEDFLEGVKKKRTNI
ncbi:MAG: helix-hairpin-helix domain-containing protein [Ginsengibacter sp.]